MTTNKQMIIAIAASLASMDAKGKKKRNKQTNSSQKEAKKSFNVDFENRIYEKTTTTWSKTK